MNNIQLKAYKVHLVPTFCGTKWLLSKSGTSHRGNLKLHTQADACRCYLTVTVTRNHRVDWARPRGKSGHECIGDDAQMRSKLKLSRSAFFLRVRRNSNRIENLKCGRQVWRTVSAWWVSEPGSLSTGWGNLCLRGCAGVPCTLWGSSPSFQVSRNSKTPGNGIFFAQIVDGLYYYRRTSGCSLIAMIVLESCSSGTAGSRHGYVKARPWIIRKVTGQIISNLYKQFPGFQWCERFLGFQNPGDERPRNLGIICSLYTGYMGLFYYLSPSSMGAPWAPRTFIKIIQGVLVMMIAITNKEAASGPLRIGLFHHPDWLRIRSNKGRVQSQISLVGESSLDFSIPKLDVPKTIGFSDAVVTVA